MTIVAIGVLMGHWLDFYLMIMPGPLGGSWHIGYLEIGLAAGYVGVFMYLVFSSLAKASLLPKNHPYLEESIHHFT